jgi:hypothetical protein
LRITGNEILCFNFAERWKGERKSLFLRHSSLKTRKNGPHFVPSDEKAKSHANFYLFGAMGKNSQVETAGPHICLIMQESVGAMSHKVKIFSNYVDFGITEINCLQARA